MNADDKLDGLLKHCPAFPNAFLIGGPADFFVTELADQVDCWSRHILLCALVYYYILI